MALFMSRIRTCKPDYWSSPQVVRCTRDARLLFIGMWNFCDDAGIHPASIMQLKMRVFPGDDCNETEVGKWMAELIKGGLVIEYTIEGKSYWQVTGWHHQKIDKPYYRYPKPVKPKGSFQIEGQNQTLEPDSPTIRQPLDERSSTTSRPFDDCSTNDSGMVVDHSTNGSLRKGMEGKGEECNGKEVEKEACKVSEATLPLFDGKTNIACTNSQYSTTDDAQHTDSSAVQDIFSYWQDIMQHPKAILDKSRENAITKALSLGYTQDQLKNAISGCSKSEFHMGKNDSKQRYNDLSLILRDSSHIENFIATYESDGANSLDASATIFDGVL